MLKTCAAFALLLWLSVFAYAAPKKVALVIGNDAYAEVPVLQKAVNDARAVAETVREIGFEVDLGENLTRREMNQRFGQFLDRIQPGDTALFFFAGHGISLNGQNVLLPVDVPGSNNASVVRSEAHVVDDLLEEVKAKGAQVSFFILDACRNNPFQVSGRRSIGGTRGLTTVIPPAGSFVLMSAGAGQEALDRLSESDPDPNSVFTRSLLPILRKPGLSHVALAKSLQVAVLEEARTIGHDQKPSYYDEIVGDYVLVPPEPSPEPAPVVAMQQPQPIADPCRDAAAHWQAIEARNDQKLFEEHVRLFPGCAFANLARLQLEKPAAPAVAAPAVAARANICDELAGSPGDSQGTGAGVQFDKIEPGAAIAACREAVASSPAEARFAFQLGRSLMKAQDAESQQWIEKAAGAGHTQAQTTLGGLLIGHDDVRARELFGKAAESGDPEAMQWLGELYFKGTGGAKDIAQSIKWYEASATAGHAPAMHRLGVMYRRGLGVQANPAKAIEWLEKGGTAGNLVSTSQLAEIFLRGEGVPRDYARARTLFEQVASNPLQDGSGVNAVVANSIMMLGLMHEGGLEGRENRATAAAYFEKIAAAGDGVAMKRLGEIARLNGETDKAREWFEKGAAAGDGGAMASLSDMYRIGEGVLRDESKALELLETGQSLGHPEALNALAERYQSGTGVPMDVTRARQMWTKASMAGSGQAMFNLAYSYQSSKDGAVHLEDAARYAEQSLRAGTFLMRDSLRDNSMWSKPFIEALQRRLKAAGVYKGAADGKLGPGTQKALDAIYDQDVGLLVP